MSLQIFILIAFFLRSLKVNSLPCDDRRCRTASCDSTGACICNLPHPSTILDGDRPFLGGKFCDEEMVMCDGTNSFWCENSGICDEIVQGENYTCKCRPGFAGVHCELSGASCGRGIFCFHYGECLSAEGGGCACPPDWRGSSDCSVATPLQTDSSKASSVANLARMEGGSASKHWKVVVIIIPISVAATGIAIYAKKVLGRKKSAKKFQQLSRMDDRFENEEADSMVRNPS